MIHVFDRGYASGSWLEEMSCVKTDFLIRWKKKHTFTDLNGKNALLSTLTRYKRSVDHKELWDEKKQCLLKTGIMFFSLKHASYAKSLWVVVVRRGEEPWYLITNVPIQTIEDAWSIYWIYRKRRKIETFFRYEKSELAIETVRIFRGEKREKLLYMVIVSQTFLLSLLEDTLAPVKTWLLSTYCHRTGKICREAKTAIYRLRWAISRFWQRYSPQFLFPALSPPSLSQKVIPNIRSENSG